MCLRRRALVRPGPPAGGGGPGRRGSAGRGGGAAPRDRIRKDLSRRKWQNGVKCGGRGARDPRPEEVSGRAGAVRGGGGAREVTASPPPARAPRPFRRRLLPAAILIASAAVLAGCAALPGAHADGGQLTVKISSDAAPSTGLTTVPFTMKFNKTVDAATLDASDIVATTGTVQNLRAVWPHNATFGSTGNGNGQFSQPAGVAVDASGRIYVADQQNHRIQIFDPAGSHVATMGGPNQGAGNGQFNQPTGVAVDGSGTIYVADTSNNRIQIFNSSRNHVANIMGGFFLPNGVAVDASGNIYVADTGNGDIKIYGPNMVLSSTIDVSPENPYAVAVDGTGKIYAVYRNTDKVEVFGSDRNHIANITGFDVPNGVAVDGSGTIYVADGAAANSVKIFDSGRTPTGTIPPDTIPRVVLFNNPNGVAVDGSGKIYVADTGNNRIRIFDTAYEFDVENPANGRTLEVSVPAGRVEDAARNGNEASNTASIVIDRTPPATTVTATQSSPTNATTINFRVEFGENVTGFERDDIALSGTAATGGVAGFAGSGASYAFDVSPTADGTIRVNIPAGAARDGTDSDSKAAEFSIRYDSAGPTPAIASTETGYTRLLTVPFTARFGETVNGSTLAASDVDASSGEVRDMRMALQHVANFGRIGQGNGQFNWPHAVAVDGFTGYLYVADYHNHRVQVFDSGRNHLATFGGHGTGAGQFKLPAGIAVDGSSGTIYVADKDNHRVQVFDSNRAYVADLPGSFLNPRGIAVDASGSVYVADSNNHRIRVFDSDRNPVANFGGRGSSDGQLKFPYDVAADASGNLYVADYGNSRIQVFDSATKAHSAYLSGQFGFPAGVAADASGNVFVADANNHRIRVFDSGMNSVANITSSFRFPYGVAVDDSSGRVYVADRDRSRIQVFDAVHAFNVGNLADGDVLEVSVPAGRVLDLVGNENEASNAASIVIDRKAPVPVVTAAQSSPTNAAAIGFTVNFTKPVDGFALGDVALSGDAARGGASNFATVNDTTYTFVVTPASDGTITVSIPEGAARDPLGNPSIASERFSIRYDGTGPTPAINSTAAGPTNLREVPFAVEFGEAVNGTTFAAADVSASSGTVQGLRLMPQFNATFGGPGSGDGQFDGPRGAAVDGEGRIYVADTGNNRVQIFDPALGHVDTFGVRGSSDGEFMNPGAVAVDASSGAIYVADTDNHRVKVFNRAGAYVEDVPGSFSYPSGVAVDGTTGYVYVADRLNNMVRVFDSDRASVANITSLLNPYGVAVDGPAGRLYVANTANHTVPVFDTATWARVAYLNAAFDRPAAVAVDGATGAVYVASAGNNRVHIFNSTTGAHVAGLPGQFDRPFGVAAGGPAGRIYVADALNNTVRIFDTAYAFDVADPDDGDVLNVTVPAGRARDAAGNDNLASNTASITIDRTGPIPTVASPQGNRTNASPIEFTVTFDEPVDGFAANNITLSGDADPGPVDGFDGSGAAYEFSTAPATDGTVTVRVAPNAVRDALGNPSAAAGLSVTYDTEGPTTTVTADQGSPTNASTITFTVRFSDPVAGFDASGITITGTAEHGGAANFATVNATTYTFVVTPTSDGTILVDVPAGAAGDLAGNDNAAAEQLAITRDTAGPAPTVTADQGSPTSAAAIGFTVNFTKPVDGFALGDVALSGDAARGGASNFATVNDTTYTFVVTPASDGTITVSIPEGAARDPLGNPSIASERFSIRYDGTGPTPAINSTAAGPTNLREVPFAVEFGEAVNGTTFAAADVSASSGTVRDLRLMPQFNATFGGPGSGDGQFDGPRGAAVDGEGRIYVADTGNNRVQIFDPALGHVDTFGVRGSSDGEFMNPGAVAVDASSGAIYVADTDNHRVKVFNRAGAYVEDVPGSFSYPSGVAVDGTTGYVYVADRLNNMVRVFDSDRASVANITSLLNPYGVAVDGPAGRLYVANTANHTVPVFDTATWARVAYLNAAFDRPAAVAVDGATGAVYVASAGNNRVHIFNSTTGAHVAGLPGQFDRPFGVAAGGPAGRIYVADALNNTVRIFDTAYAFDVADPDEGQLEVTVPAGRARDAAGNDNLASNTASITIDRTGPIPTVASPQGNRTNASPIEFTVTFDEPVDGFAANNITLSGDADPGPVDGFDGSGAAYEFSTAPATDGTVTVRVAPNAVRDALGNPSAAAGLSVTYDTEGPTTTITSAQPPATSASTITFTVRFSDPVAGFDASGITITGTAEHGGAANFATVNATTYTFVVTPTSDGTILVDVPAGAAGDLAGNDNAAAEQLAITRDTAGPAPTVTADQGSPTSAAAIGFTVNFTKPVDGFALGDVALSGDAARGGASNFATVNDTTYTFVVTPASDGTITVSIPEGAARDPLGNPSIASERFSIRYDGTGPTPAINSTAAGPTSLREVPFAVEFGEAVNGTTFAAADVSASSGTVQGLRLMPQFNATFGGPGSGDGQFDGPRGAAVDGEGRIYVADTGNNRVQIFDPALGHVDTIGGPGSGDGEFMNPGAVAVNASSGAIYVADTGNHRVQVFDRAGAYVEDVPGHFSNPSGVAVDGTTGYVYVADRNNNVVQVFDSDRANVANITSLLNPYGVAVDGPAGRLYVANTANHAVHVFDTATRARVADLNATFVQPTAVAVDGATGAVYVASAGSGAVLIFNSTTSDRIAGLPGQFDRPFGVAAGGPAGRIYVADALNNTVRIFDTAYAFDVADPDDGDVLNVTVPAGRARDAAGNPNAESNTASITIDRTGPIPTVASPQGNRTNASPIEFTVTFDEPVDGFAANNITLSGDADPGPVDGFDGSGDTYTFSTVPATDGTVTVRVAPNAVRDALGNPSAAAGLSVTYDTEGPSTTVTADQGSPTNAAAITFTVKFSDPVAGFDASGITITGTAEHGGAANFATVNATTYTFVVTPTSDGTILVDVPAGAAGDLAGNDNAAAEQLAITRDTAGPAPTVTADQGSPTNAAAIGFTVNFTESATGFAVGDVALTGAAARGGAANFATVNDTTYTFDVSPASDGTIAVSIPEGAAEDHLGNPSIASERFSIRYDGTGPTPAIAYAQSGATDLQTMPFAVEFGEAVNGTTFAAADVSASSGTVQGPRLAPQYNTTFGSLGSDPGEFDTPEGVAVDGSGNIYVADSNNNRVQIFDSARNYVDSITGTAGPNGVAVDGSTGNIYASYANGTVQAYGPDMARIAALPHTFQTPGVVAVDGAGNIYVSDTPAGRVAIFDSARTHVADITAFVPFGVAADGGGNIYVGYSNGTVQAYGPDRAHVGALNGTFDGPRNIAVDGSGRIYVASSAGSTVRVFDSARTHVADLPGAFSTPYGVAVDGTSGAIYVANQDTHSILTFDAAYAFNVTGPAAGDVLTVSVPAGGARDEAGNDNLASNPVSIGIDATGPTPAVEAAQRGPTNADTINFRVNFGESVDGFEASDVVLSGPADAVDDFAAPNATAYSFNVSPTADGIVRADVPAGAATDQLGDSSLAAERFSIIYDGTPPTPTINTTAAGPASLSTVPFTVKFDEAINGTTLAASDVNASSGTVRDPRLAPRLSATVGGPPSGAGSAPGSGPGEFFSPYGIAVDASGRVYVADTGNARVQVFGPDGNHIADISTQINQTAHPSNPLGVAVDAYSGRIYVADALVNRTLVFGPDRNYIADLPGPFYEPYGVAVDGAGRAYVANHGNGTVQVFDSERNHIADLPVRFDQPYAVAAGSAGRIYVADTGSDRVQIFDSARNYVADLPGPFAAPVGVAVDGSGNAYVSNSGSDRVQIFDSAGNYTAADLPGPLVSPAGIATDASGAVYVVEQSGNRFKEFGVEYAFDVEDPAHGQLEVSLPAGRARDAAGNPNAGSNAVRIAIDVEGPTPIVSADRGSPTTASPIGFTVDFGEPVDGFSAANVTLSGTAAHGGVAGFEAVSATAYTFDVSPTSGGTILVDVPAGAARDKLGNPSGAAARFSITYDGIPIPTVTADQGSPTNAPTIKFRVEFGEPVDGFNASGIAITGTAAHGGAANFVAVSATAYTFDVSPTSGGTILVDVPEGAAVDATGNPSRAARWLSILYDGAPPAPEITTTAAGPASLSTVPFTVKFGEAINGTTLNASDVDASSGAVRNLRISPQLNLTLGTPSDGKFDAPWGVAVDGPAGVMYVANFASLGVQALNSTTGAHIADLTGPANGTSAVAVDGSGSVYVSNLGNDTVQIFDSGGNHVAELPGPFDSPSGIAVDGSGNAYVSNQGNDTVQIFDSGGNYVADLPRLFNGPSGIAVDGSSGRVYVASTLGGGTVQIFDSGGNHVGDLPGPFDRPYGVAADGPSGVVYVTNDGGGHRVQIFNSTTWARIADLPAAFNQPLGVAADGSSGSVYVTSVSRQQILVFDTAYEFDVADPDEGQLEVSLPAGRARDAAGNDNLESNTVSVTIDRTGPIPTVASPQGPLTNSPTIDFTVTFDQPVDGFNASDIALSGTADPGPAADFNGSGAAYAFSTAPATDGTVTVRVAPNAVRDALGNPSLAAGLSVTYDTEGPSTTVTADQGSPTSAAAITFTVRFSDPVAGFNASGIALSGTAAHGGAGSFTAADNATYTVAVTPTSDGTIRVDVPAGMARDAAGNGNEAAAGLSIVRDTAGPAAAVAPAQPGPTNLAAVPFSMTFSEGVAAAAFDESDINASSGTVQDLRMVLRYNHTIGEENASSADRGKFGRPFGLAVDGSGHLYVAERAGKRIQVFDPAGNSTAAFGGLAADPDDPEPGRFLNIYGIAVDASSGRTYVADSVGDRVLIYDHGGEYLADLPGAPETPVALAVNATGHVYVSNAGNDTVQIFDSSGNWAAALSGTFGEPRGVAFGGPAGHVYVADRNNDTVRVFDSNGMPAGNFGSNGSGAGQFARPVGVAVDDLAGRIYVTERGNQRVQAFDSNGSHVSYLSGFPNALGNPRAVAADAPSGRVYVADTEHHRVLVFVAAYEFSVADPADNQTLTVSVPAGRTRDAAGNGNAESNAASIEIDRTRPIPTVALSGPANGTTISFTVTFGENVTGFEAEDVELSGAAVPGGVANFATADNTTYTFSVSPASNGTILVDVAEGAARDRAGNNNTAAAQFSIVYDGAPPVAPVPTVTSDAGPGPTSESPIGFTVTFSKNVTGFNASGIEISGSAGAGATVTNFSGSGRTYAFDVEPTSVGAVLVDIPANVAVDADGNANEAAMRFSISYTGAAPVPTIASDAQPGPARVSPIGFTVTFSENVTGFNASGIEISGSAGAGATVDNFVNASGRTYSFDVAPLTVGTVLVDIPEGAAADSDGNANTAAQFSILYTGAVPVPTVTSDAPPGPTSAVTINFAVTFSEGVAGFNASGIALSGTAGHGGAENFAGADNATYTFAVTPTSDGTVRIDIPAGVARDADGNGNEAAAGLSVVRDTAGPAAAVAPAQAGPTNLAAVPFSMTFSEGVSAAALDESDINASSGTVQDLRMVLRYNHTIGEENASSADPGKFNRPFGLAVDGSGYLYVAERAGKRVQVFDPAGNSVATFGGHSKDPNPDPGLFNNIYGIAVDASSGRTYVADSVGNRVLIYDHDREYLADLPGAPETPIALAVNASGHVYVSNAGNDTVQIFDSSWNWAAALPGPFNGTRGVAFDGPAGLAYVADRNNNTVRVFDLNGMPAGNFGSLGNGTGQFTQPIDVAVDDLAGRIYVTEKTDNQRVQVFDSDRSHVSYLSGFPNALENPRAVAADAPSGRVYVADTEHHRVLVFVAAYEFIVANPDDNQTLTVSLPAGRARDAAGNGNEASGTASIEIDRTRPIPAVALSGPADAATINFTVTFDENVTGFEADDVELSGTAGTGAAVANFSGSGRTYAFGAAPAAGGTVTVGIPENAAEDDAGNGNEAALFSVNYTGAPPAPVPTITSDAQPGPATESPINFTVTFSKNVTGFNASGIVISGAASGIDAGSFVLVNATTYTFAVSPAADGTVTVDVPAGAAEDSEDGTASAAATRFSIQYTAAPVPTITSDAQPGPATESPINFTVTFSKNVTGFEEGDVEITGAAGIDDGSFVPVNATTYTFAVSPAADGTVTVDVPAGAAEDSEDGTASAAATRFSIQYTGAAPVPTITSGAGPGPATESPIAFTVTFSKNVTGFEEGDVEITGAAGIDEGSFVAVNATTYTFAVSPAADGTVTVDVPAGAAAGAADGTASAAAAQFSIQYTGAAPVPTITSDAQPGPATESPINFTVTFSKNVTGFEEGDVVISGIVSSIDDGSFVAVNATTYTFAVSPAADGTVAVDVPVNVAADAGGNNNTAAAQFSIEYNAAPPAPAAAPVPTITSDVQPGPATESPIAFTVTFSKNVTGFDAGGIVISGAASGIDAGSFVPVNATTYTFAVSPTANGTVRVDVPANVAADAGGNNNTAAAQFTIVYNGAPPAAQLVVESAAITGPQSITIRYDADANATGSAYGPIVVGGTPRSATLTGAGTDTHVLQFDGDPAARDATGTVTINQTAVTDPAGRPLGNNETYQLALADGQAPVLASAVLDLTAGENGLLVLAFDEAAAAAPDAPLFGETIVIRGDGGEVALSGSDIPSMASGRAGGTTFALDVSGAKRVELNAAELGPAAIELPAAFVSDASGNEYAPGQQPVPLAYVPDPSPPRLAAAAFNLAPGSGNAGRLVITFDKAATAPGAESFSGTIEIRGRSWGGDAAVSLPAADILSVESGSTGDRTFVLLVSDRARSLLDAAAFSVPESTSVLLPAGFVTNGRAAHAPERAPLDVARDPDGPTFLLAFVLNGSSVTAVYSEPVLAAPSHYTNITVDGAAVAGNGSGASEAAAFGDNVIVSWNAGDNATAAPGSAVGFDLSANVTDAFGNPVVNPGTKYTGGPDGTGQAGKQPVQVGVFARGAADPSAEAARLGAAAFNAVSSERGYAFYVNVSEHDLPAGASGAAALRGAHAAGEGPSLYVGPASDIALAGMADYASENGITIISHSSAARPLAVGGDPIFRMEPGAAHMARALATEVARGGYGAIVPVVQAGLHGPDYGLLESLESDIRPLGISVGDPVAFAGGGGAAAVPISDAVAEAAGSGTTRSVAVVYMGSDTELAAMAGSVPAGGPVRERSAWFAVGGAGAGAGSGVAASPAITADAAAVQLARDVQLSAVQFAVERNSMTDYIDRIAAPRGPAASATPAYAAYEAVRALGGALVGAGGDPSLARENIAGAANLEGGPLGRTGMDGNGDLRLPVTYGAWSVSDVSAEWARAPELLLGLDACGIDLEKSALALPELAAGSTSRPARQTVTNIGTGPMPAVSVSATDWTQFSDGVPLPGPLPFSYTEMAVGLGGASPRPADSTPLAADTAIPGGTPPGGSVDVDFRINLGELDTLEADIISQTVTFVANCS